MTSTRIDRPDRDVRKQGSPSTQHYSQTICPDARQPTLTLTLFPVRLSRPQDR